MTALVVPSTQNPNISMEPSLQILATSLKNDNHGRHECIGSSLSSSSSSSSSSTEDHEDGTNNNHEVSSARVFPWQLHSMLEAASKEGFDHIVSWLDDSASFKVHDPALFVKEVLPRFFERQSKYKSFQRQLNIWQFERLIGSRGPCNGGYYHVNFHRTKTSKFHLIKRLKIVRRRRRSPRCRPTETPLNLPTGAGLQIQATLQYLTSRCIDKKQGSCGSKNNGITNFSFMSPAVSTAKTDNMDIFKGNHPLLHHHHDTEVISSDLKARMSRKQRTGAWDDGVALALTPSWCQQWSLETNIPFTKPLLEMNDRFAETVTSFFSPSSLAANENVPKSGIMDKNYEQDHAHRGGIRTSSPRTNNVVWSTNNSDSTTTLDTEGLTQILSQFLCSAGGNKKTNNANEEGECDLKKLTPMHEKNEQEALAAGITTIKIAPDEWRYVLIGLRIGAMASS